MTTITSKSGLYSSIHVHAKIKIKQKTCLSRSTWDFSLIRKFSFLFVQQQLIDLFIKELLSTILTKIRSQRNCGQTQLQKLKFRNLRYGRLRKKINKSHEVNLNVFDDFSNYGRSIPLEKKSQTMANQFSSTFFRSTRQPNPIGTDDGKNLRKNHQVPNFQIYWKIY